ncbi:glucose 1-dehydrogenase [Aestuariivirga sp.]|uniref:glucose 1-dehydrogenase n=1 Tax=Aestuariivirga sp. TaxID=2650926 RepID=UPI00391DEE31
MWIVEFSWGDLMPRVAGKVAFVTGAAEGIGYATADLLAEEGAFVVLADINERAGIASAERISTRHGARATFVRLDVADEENWATAIASTVASHSKLDILVNNAGIQMTQPLEEISLADWRRVFATNAEGTFLGTRTAIGHMKVTGGGTIINVSSTYAMVADGLNAHYCASKAAVRNFTKAAALYCADRSYNIRVNSVHPGVIRTPMLDREIRDVSAKRGLPSTETVEREWAQICPLGLGEPRDIAAGILYLVSDDSRYVTGSELVIDGGHIIR